MDRVPELYLGVLAILKMGGVAQPLFSAFGEESLGTRLADAGTAAIITQKKHLSKVRKIRDTLPALQHVIVVDAPAGTLKEDEVALALDELPACQRFERASHDGRVAVAAALHVGHDGPAQGRAARARLAGGPVHHDPPRPRSQGRRHLLVQRGPGVGDGDDRTGSSVRGRAARRRSCWTPGSTPSTGTRSSQKHRVTVWYSAPTAIRLLMREGTDLVRKFDLSSLRHLCSVGEPLNPEAVVWSQQAFGRPFHDTFWQTETGCIVITNLPGMQVKPGSMGKPFPGITACVLDPQTNQPITETGRVGLIALRPGWPSMLRGYWKNPTAYEKKFRNGWYICGDRASVDADGYFWFVGRDDDVINTGGHLVGPFEIESALLEHPAVAESAAVAKPDKINMEVVKAFVTLKPGYTPSADLELEIMNVIRKRLSPLAMPQEIEFVASLPKTRSGKIVRRVLRAQEWGQPVGDISTLMEE